MLFNGLVPPSLVGQNIGQIDTDLRIIWRNLKGLLELLDCPAALVNAIINSPTEQSCGWPVGSL